MKASVAQINTTPGDFAGNFRRIFNCLEKESDTDVMVFPEMTICGYGVRDMLHEKGFIKKNLDTLQEIVKVSQNISYHIVVGYVDENHSGAGKKFRNMAAVIYRGNVITTYQKQLLAWTDVFDEGRWFEPGNQPCVVTIKGCRCGITICEDMWNDRGQDDYNHKNNPLQIYREKNCDTILNLSSSPYYNGKPNLRKLMFKEIIDTGPIKNIVYANQYGGQDELVFDGHSTIICNNGRKDYIKNPIIPRGLDEVEVLTMDLDAKCFINSWNFVDDKETHASMVLLGLHDYAKKIGMTNFVVGSSGGIDSAVVIALAAMAFGPEKVHAIKMPSRWSSDHSVEDARNLHKNFGVNDYQVRIDHDPLIQHINHSMGFVIGIQNIHGNDVYNKVADENIQARMRGQVVMHYSNATGALPLTTGNKTELALGYCTLYGDMNGGFNPIGDLYKLEVYEIAKFINNYYGKEMIPQNIIDKAPSAELAPGQTDEASLLPYPILDPLVKSYIEFYNDSWGEFEDYVNNTTPNQMVVEWCNDYKNKETFDRMINRIINMEFKRRQAAPCTKLTRKSFGIGRRLPIVRK